MPNFRDLTWERFWRLTVLWLESMRNHASRRKCKCECGNDCIIKSASLGNKTTQSCWCLLKEKQIECNTTHWMSRSRFERLRNWIKQRCNNKKSKAYKHYWLRWIQCERQSFEDFRDNMYESYLKHVEEYWEKETTLDRYPNKDGNYTKDNCRRATRKQQNNNTASNNVIEYEWKSMTVQQRAEYLWINSSTLRVRLHRNKRPLRKVFTP